MKPTIVELKEMKYTISDAAVKDVLRVFGKREHEHKTPAAVVYGGIANQVYLSPSHPHLVRATHDVDYIVDVHLTPDLFRSTIGKELGDEIEYHTELRKLRTVLELSVADEDGDTLFVHTHKWTANGYARAKKDLARQIANSELVVVPGVEYPVRLTRPEDIAFRKFVRLQLISRYGKTVEGAQGAYNAFLNRDWERLAELDIASELDRLQKDKTALPHLFDRGEDEFKAACDNYVTRKDLYDVSALMHAVAQGAVRFDEKYYGSLVDSLESNLY